MAEMVYLCESGGHQMSLHLTNCNKSVVYQNEILKLGRVFSMGGHLGINKTYSKIIKHFYWPQIRHCVAEYFKTCHICQMMGSQAKKIL